MLSCLYQGYVQHRRLSPAEHVFRYGLYLMYLDLEELPALLEGGYGLHQGRFSPASFCRSDHLGDPCVPLADAVRGLVEERTGLAADRADPPAHAPAELGLLFLPAQPVLLL